jgi:polysaccharide pyruvyl transferase WcaK-like protein
MHDFIEPEASYQDFLATFRSISQSFGSLQAWMEFLSSQDLVIGKRIHGSMAALQLGIPSILLSHDSRTKELAQTLKIPSIDLQHAAVGNSKESIRALVDAVQFDAAAFASRREQLWSAMGSLFRENGLELTKAEELSQPLT